MALSNATELADWGSGIGTGPLQIDNVNKRIGIGTTAPLAQTDIFNQTGVTTTLLVRQVGDYDILRLEDEATPDSSPFIVKADGKVGIGTQSPSTPLHLYDTTNNIVFLESGDTNADIIQADTDGSTRIRSGSGRLLIYTHGDASSLNASNSAQAVRINQDGQVGLGSHTPNVKLDIREIKEGGDVQIRVFNLDNSATNTQTASINLSPDSRALAGTGLQAFKENIDFTTSGARDVSMIFNTVLNNSQNERMRLNSSGQLGIGQTLPYGKLHVKEGASGLTAANSNANTVFIENSANAGLSIATPNSNTGYLTFADPEDDNVGMIIYRHDHGSTPNSMAFFVNGTERVNIDAYGRLLVGINTAMNTGSNDHRDTLQVVDTAGGQLLLGRNDSSGTVDTNRLGEVAALGNDSDGVYEPCASIRFEADNSHSTGDKSTAIVFKTCKDSTDDLYERVRISNFGGIGLAAGGHVGSASTDFGKDNQCLTSDGSVSQAQWRYVNTPCFYGWQDTAQSINNQSYTRLNNLGNGVINADAHGGWDESTGTFTCPADSGGIYVFYAGVGVNDLDNADQILMRFYYNDGGVGPISESRAAGNNEDISTNNTIIYDMAVDDTMEVRMYHNQGGALNTSTTRCFFGGYRLSAHP